MRTPARLIVALVAVVWMPQSAGRAEVQSSVARVTSPSDDPATRGVEQNRLGIEAFGKQLFAEAEQHWMAALAEFERAGMLVERANLLRNLTFLPRLSLDDRAAILDEARAIASGSGDSHVLGLIHAQLADFDFIRGDYGAASVNLDLAIPLLEQQPRSRVALARALTSLGRLQALLNRMEAALHSRQRAAAILEDTNDFAGVSQAHHGIALSHLRQGQTDAAVAAFARAVELARRSGDARRLGASLAQSAIALQRAGRADEALARLQEASLLATPDIDKAHLSGNWGDILLALDRPADALTHLDRALATTAEVPEESRMIWLGHRAAALDRLGRTSEGLETSSRAVQIVEGMRARLAPEDEAKRGFAESRQLTLTAHVSRLAAAHRADEAMEAAERARARAFLDLLATANLRSAGTIASPATGAPATQPAPAPRGTTAPEPSPVSQLDVLLATRRGARPTSSVTTEPEISSVAVVEPPTLASIKAQAARLRSHLLSYWVTADRVLIWLVAPDGRVTSATTDISATRLASLVNRTFAEVGGPTRGGTRDEPVASAAGGDDQGSGTAAATAAPIAGVLRFGEQANRANRELYLALIAPVRAQVPEGRLLTVVPHGPLFRLAFAALVSPAGKYLVEEFPLHHAPSVSTLAFTERRTAPATGPVVVVADPAVDQATGGDEALPRLPGAAREGRRILTATARHGEGRLLQGARATEREVRTAIGGARVLHFATHGIVRDDRPFDSFLALAGHSAEPSDDGKLMAGEVYGLHLQADIVVLGACRSAAGPVTGDGIVGLTRGFFAAGTPSVMASLWDVPDALTASIFPAFYTQWAGGRSKAEALRGAQLAMIRELRAGRVSVSTPAGRFVLQEHPAVWAGSILVGEP